MAKIKKADWVTCGNSDVPVGIVTRVSQQYGWADVNWGWHSKRMPVTSLQVQASINIGNGWTVTDLEREQELSNGR